MATTAAPDMKVPTTIPTAVPTHTVQSTPAPWNEPPVVADDPADLAAQIVMAERAIRDINVTGDKLAWMGNLQQVTYRKLVETPDWREAVLNALPEDVLPAASANLEAGLAFRAMVSPGETLPSWRIVAPPPHDVLMRYYQEAEDEFGVPWSYLAAVNLVETFMGRIRGTSVAGAQGPMQFMPATWEAFGEGDVNDYRDAIRAAARYLAANGAPGDMAYALYRYNPSEDYVRGVTLYAETMRLDPSAYRGYYHWQVYYLTTEGDRLLPVGFGED